MPHRLFVLLFGILFMGLLPGSARQSPDKIWHKLDSIQNYRTEFTYTVTLPLTDSEINYRAELSYRKNPIDTLCGYSYLYNPQIQISEKSQTKRIEIADSRKTKRPKIDKRTTHNKRHSNAIITL